MEPNNSIGGLSRAPCSGEDSGEWGGSCQLHCSSNQDQAPMPCRDVTGRSSKKGQPQLVSSSEENPGLGHLECGNVRGHSSRRSQAPVLFGDVTGRTSSQDQALSGIS